MPAQDNTDHVFTIPNVVYKAEVSIGGTIYSVPVQAGQTVTPLYNAVTQEVTWEVFND